MAKIAKVRRKDIIQQDQFISTTDVIIAYCSKHKAKIISLFLSLMLVFLLGFWHKYNQNQKTLEMEALYFKLEQAKYKEDTNLNDKIKKMELLLEEFSEGPQKQRAFLIIADEFFKKGDYDSAIKFYNNILKDSSISLSHQLANIGIAYSLEAKEDYTNAINAFKTVIQYPNNYPLFDIYMGLARCYELNSNINEALLILREMQSKFSANPKINSINSKIKKLDI
jgi:lipopolysaccharide biosynthesis regulator YciM